MPDALRKLLEGRSHWMNALMLFCMFMTFAYLPWDIFWKPAANDQEVWFGYMFTGTAAKVAAIPHWLVYGAGAYGFWQMKSWMWPWAAVYSAQVAIGMLLWPLLELGGVRGVVGGLVSFLPFAWLTWALWQARPVFQGGEAGPAETR